MDSQLKACHLSFLGSKTLHGLLHLLPCFFSTQLLFFQDAQLALGPVVLLMRILGFLLSSCCFCRAADKGKDYSFECHTAA